MISPFIFFIDCSKEVSSGSKPGIAHIAQLEVIMYDTCSMDVSESSCRGSTAGPYKARVIKFGADHKSAQGMGNSIRWSGREKPSVGHS